MERTTEEWGRVAVSLPGWRWMRGMQTLPLPTPGVPDPDDPATAGCLLALLGPRAHMHSPNCDWEETDYWELVIRLPDNSDRHVYGDTLGRACIAGAEALGRWPGGAA